MLLRGAVSLAERCRLAASSREMQKASMQTFVCGATAYPELTGRRPCGRFNFLDLRHSPRCRDVNRTRPVCNWKLGTMKAKTYPGGVPKGLDWAVMGVHAAAGFREMPSRLRHAPTAHTVPAPPTASQSPLPTDRPALCGPQACARYTPAEDDAARVGGLDEPCAMGRHGMVGIGLPLSQPGL